MSVLIALPARLQTGADDSLSCLAVSSFGDGMEGNSTVQHSREASDTGGLDDDDLDDEVCVCFVCV